MRKLNPVNVAYLIYRYGKIFTFTI